MMNNVWLAGYGILGHTNSRACKARWLKEIKNLQLIRIVRDRGQ
jgi:hypothetical protein